MPNHSIGAVITSFCSALFFAVIAIFCHGRANPGNLSAAGIGGIFTAAANQYVMYAAILAVFVCLLGAVLLNFQPRSRGKTLDDVFKEHQRESK
jgi:hypothetical protein